MMKYKKIIIILIFLLAFMAFDGLVYAQTITEGSKSIEVNLYGDDISVSGKLNEINKDITIVVYRISDNAKYYIDQDKTNENGEYSFQFSLPNGTYKAVVNCGSLKYTTSNIVVYKEPSSGEEEEINVVVNGIKVNVNGKINEKNKDISIKVYRNSDNAIAYIDQGKTNENGEYSFQFSLPNGTYKAVVSCGLLKYTTSNIVVYEEPTGGEEEEINVAVNGDKVNVSGKINEKNKDVSIKVYRNSDNAIAYIDQSKTNENGEFSFQFSLANGTYKATVSCGLLKYTTSDIVINKEAEIVSATISPNKANFDKNPNKQQDVTTVITYNDAEQVVDVKKGSSSIGTNNYSMLGNILTIKKAYLSSQEKGDLELTIEFDKGQSATFTISITQTSSGSGGSSTKRPDAVNPDNSLIMLADINGHWAEERIKELIILGVLGGYPDGTFKPDNNITRAEFSTVLVKAFNLKIASGNKFDDIKNHWAREFITAAAENKIVLGYGDNLFGPDDLITREQMAVMVVKALKLEAKEYENSFEDKDQISDWAKEYITTSVHEKLIVGYPDNTFRPKSNATRAEAVTVILNALNSIEK